jgi:hypothetical protein
MNLQVCADMCVPCFGIGSLLQSVSQFVPSANLSATCRWYGLLGDLILPLHMVAYEATMPVTATRGSGSTSSQQQARHPHRQHPEGSSSSGVSLRDRLRSSLLGSSAALECLVHSTVS